MGYVFISYSSKNQSVADATRELFHNKGIDCWMAPNDIPAGSKYAAVITGALKQCACLVLLLTQESQDSEWVEKEVERAISYKKSIITMQFEDIVLNDCYEYYLCNQQIVPIQKIDVSSNEIIKVLDAVIAFTGVKAKKEVDFQQGAALNPLSSVKSNNIGFVESSAEKPQNTALAMCDDFSGEDVNEFQAILDNIFKRKGR